MGLHRRTILGASFIAVPALSNAGRSARLRPALTASTAPDAVSRKILSEYMRSRSFGAARAIEFPDAVHRGFGQVIEQNFAERDVASTTVLLDGMSEAELSDLAQLYVNATSAYRQPERLMSVLANRLNERRLARVSRHFGFERTYHAVYSIAPSRVEGFVRLADPYESGPVPGELRFGSQGRFAPAAPTEGRVLKMLYRSGMSGWRMTKTAPYTQFLHSTPTEIYHAMRTARYGSLSLEGAFLETASILAGAYGRAFGVGFGFGNLVVQPVVEAYAPTLYIGLGNWIGPIVDAMIDAWNVGEQEALGEAHTAAAESFAVGPYQIDEFRISGGDFSSVVGLTTGGGGGGVCSRGCSFFAPL